MSYNKDNLKTDYKKLAIYYKNKYEMQLKNNEILLEQLNNLRQNKMPVTREDDKLSEETANDDDCNSDGLSMHLHLSLDDEDSVLTAGHTSDALLNSWKDTFEPSDYINIKLDLDTDDESDFTRIDNENSADNKINRNVDNVDDCNNDDLSMNLNLMVDDVDVDANNNNIKVEASESRTNETNGSNKCKTLVNRANVTIRKTNGKFEIKVLNKENTSDDNRLMCPCCTTTFKNRFCLRRHIINVHLCESAKNKKIYKCHICAKRFYKMEVLSEHLGCHRTDDDVIECSYCHSVFKDYFSYKTHTRFLSCIKFNNVE